jgi:hypothetical protein
LDWGDHIALRRRVGAADEFLTVDTVSNRTMSMAAHNYAYDARGNRATQSYGSSTATYFGASVIPQGGDVSGFSSFDPTP